MVLPIPAENKGGNTRRGRERNPLPRIATRPVPCQRISGKDLIRPKDTTDAVTHLTGAATVTGEILNVDGGAHFGRW